MLNGNTKIEVPTDDDANRFMGIANEIIDVFASHNLSYEEAYMILASLSDAIYLYSITVE